MASRRNFGRYYLVIIFLLSFIGCQKVSSYHSLYVNVIGSNYEEELLRSSTVTDEYYIDFETSKTRYSEKNQFVGTFMLYLFKDNEVVFYQQFNTFDVIKINRLESGQYLLYMYSFNDFNNLPELEDLSLSIRENDLMYFSKVIDLNESLSLDVLFKHAFSSISVNLVSNVGSIADVQLEVYPHQDRQFKYNISNNSFKQSNKNKTIYQYYDNLFITNDVIDGKIIIKSITINGITKNNIVIDNLTFKRGYKYKMTININDFLSLWAPGNLIYNNGIYSFANSQCDLGDHWFWNYLTPFKENTLLNYQLVNIMTDYQESRGPCTMVQPIGTWITPSVADFEKLMTYNTDKYNTNAVKFGSIILKKSTTYGDCGYWTREAVNSNNAKVLRLTYGNNEISQDYKATMSEKIIQIRCIKK